jgi:hypothetical protein
MSDLTKKINLVSEFATLSKTVDFNDFYHIGIDVSRSKVTLQGHISPMTINTAKQLDLLLEFDNETGMLIGVSEDDKLRIVLT